MNHLDEFPDDAMINNTFCQTVYFIVNFGKCIPPLSISPMVCLFNQEHPSTSFLSPTCFPLLLVLSLPLSPWIQLTIIFQQHNEVMMGIGDVHSREEGTPSTPHPSIHPSIHLSVHPRELSLEQRE